MRRSLPFTGLRPVLIAVAASLPLLCALVALGLALVSVPPGGAIRLNRDGLLIYLLIGLIAALPITIISIARLRSRSGGAQIEVLAEGLEPGDTDLIQRLFPNSTEVRLSPLSGGFSGATVLRAQSWGGAATLQRASVVKIGTTAKLQPEAENFERYVREYVGNTATLLNVTQRGGRMGLRWAYASFIGERVRTLADVAATGVSLATVIDDLFSSGSTLGLLLGTPRRDPQYALYREYSWTPRDWQKILRATEDLLGGEPLQPQLSFAPTPLPNPLAMVAHWCDPQTGSGTRSDDRFDVPVATIHGDLNSRNILIDERGTIFVIDFAQSGPGHLLRDFARLEAELLLVLEQPQSEEEVAARVAQAGRLLCDDQPCATLRDLLGPRPREDWRSEAIIALRAKAHDYAGPWLNTPASSYLVALLHAVLDTLRYVQCTPPTKRMALLIAGRLCQALE